MEINILFPQLHKKLTDVIIRNIDWCDQWSMVVGFITPGGINAISDAIRSQPSKLKRLIVGAGTLEAFKAIANLDTLGVDPSKIRVHLGYYPEKGLAGYRPMLHGKAYLFNRGLNGRVIVGSHNLTHYSFDGVNAEISIEICDETSKQPLFGIHTFINACWDEACPFESKKIDGYAEWTRKYISYIASKTRPIDSDNGWVKRKILFIVLRADRIVHMNPSDSIYIEVPTKERGLRALDIDVHLYIQSSGPSSPRYWMRRTEMIKQAFQCEVTSTGEVGEATTYNVDFSSTRASGNRIRPVGKPYSPTPHHGIYQVVLRVKKVMKKRYHYAEYLPLPKWSPVLSNEIIHHGFHSSNEFSKPLPISIPIDKHSMKEIQDEKIVFRLVENINLIEEMSREEQYEEYETRETPLVLTRFIKEL